MSYLYNSGIGELIVLLSLIGLCNLVDWLKEKLIRRHTDKLIKKKIPTLIISNCGRKRKVGR